MATPPTIPALLATAASDAPDAPALVDDGRVITRSELLDDATARARAIVHALDGADPRAPVALLAHHGADAIIAALAVTLTGRPYLYLEPSNPDLHLAGLLERCGCSVILADEALHDRADTLVDGIRALRLDERRDGPPLPAVPPDQPAVVAFTSGSTGRPKGVVHDHRSVVHAAASHAEVLRLEPGDHVAVLFSLGFLASVPTLFATLGHGGVVRPYDVRTRGVHEFADWAEIGPVRVLPLTPAVFRSISDVAEERTLPAVRTVTLGGDRVLPSDVERRRRLLPGADLVVILGSSEALPMCVHTVDDEVAGEGAPVPVGRAAPGKTVRIVDEHGEPVAAGETGMLRIYAETLATGYWDEPDLTAAAFGEDRHGRYFQTGDLARERADGCIEYLGRSDDRLKVRGITVEVAEIEATLLQVRGVARAAVVGVTGDDGETELVAHLVVDDANLTVRAVRRLLTTRLPGHLIPHAFVVQDTFPESERGKLDRAALARSSGAALPSGRVGNQQPRNENEALVVRCVESVLAVEGVNLNDDFFDLGGDSLAAMELAAMLSDELGTEIGLRQLVRDPTVAGMSAAVSSDRPPDPVPSVQSLRPGGPDRLVLIAGAGGTLLEFVGLVRHLPPGPEVIGIEARGTSSRESHDRTVERMARRVVDAIPDGAGSLVLAGYSLGGVIALEAAQQLRAAGRAPDHLVLLDSASPPATRPPSPPPEEPASPRSRRSQVRAVRYWPGRSRRWLRLRFIGRSADFGPRRYKDLFAVGARALSLYVPRPWDGPVTVVSSEAPPVGGDLLGWDAVLTGDAQRVEVRGDHETMLQEPWVSGLAEALAAVVGQERSGT